MIDASTIRIVNLNKVKLRNIEVVDMFVSLVENTGATRVLISSFGFPGATTKVLPMCRFKALNGFLNDLDKKMIIDTYTDFESQEKTVWIVLSENKNKIKAAKMWLNSKFGLEKEAKDDSSGVL